MIIDDINYVEKLIEEERNYEDIVKTYENYSAFLTTLHSHYAEFNNYIKMVEALNDYNESIFGLPNLNSILKILGVWLTKVTTSMEKLEKANIQFLVNDETNQHNTIKSKWTSYVVNISKDITAILKNLKPLLNTDQSNKVKTITNDISLVLNKQYITAADTKKLDSALKSAQDLIDALEVNDEIKKFLNKIVSNTGATLDDLNDEIVKWLKKNNFTPNIKLSFANNGGINA